MNENNPGISVIGLGKLGFPLAACFASKGHPVVGVDINQSALNAFKLGISPGIEPGLDAMVADSYNNLRSTDDYLDAISSTSLTFIIVPTPSNPEGQFENTFVLKACQSIGLGLAQKNSYHLVVVVSTVMPGSIDGEIKKCLEKNSGKKCGEDFGLCYGPTFVALGSVIQNLLRPDYLLIGESDNHAGAMLEQIYTRFCDNEPPIIRMNFVNAELTKLANNTFVSTKITFGNMLSQICERLPGAHIDVVTAALGLDSRIGEKFLKGGLGYGGPCLVRDNVALSSIAAKIGANPKLPQATHQSNEMEVGRLINLIKSKRIASGVVGVLGLAYKPDTDVVDESPGMILSKALAAEGIPVVAFDPAAMGVAQKRLHGLVSLAKSTESCIEQSQVVVIATPWEEFKNINSNHFNPPGSKILIDCWRIIEPGSVDTTAEHVMLGVGPVDNSEILNELTVPQS